LLFVLLLVIVGFGRDVRWALDVVAKEKKK
jgi:hypothetical protein